MGYNGSQRTHTMFLAETSFNLDGGKLIPCPAQFFNKVADQYQTFQIV